MIKINLWEELVMKKGMLYIVCSIVASGMIAGCSSPPPSSLTVPLLYSLPSTTADISLGGQAFNAKIFMAPVTDARTEKDSIGVSEERPPAMIPIYGEGSPVEFVGDGVNRAFSSVGLNTVASPGASTRIVEIDLLRFWVVETSTYAATVSGRVRVKDASGSVLWEGSAMGTGKNFGRTLSAENYRETLSRGVTAFAYELLRNPGFMKAL